MMNLPAAIATITGHPRAHSLNSEPGVDAFVFSASEESAVSSGAERYCPNASCAMATNTGPRRISWSNSHQGQIASGVITAEMNDPNHAWFRIALGQFVQQITLVSRPRHFGGRQWFFECPSTKRLASVLWRPPGASKFCSRQAWGRQVAYRSQFQNASDRAYLGKERIKARLIGDLDPEDWELPPKPKWMRWETYNRYVERFDDYEERFYGAL
jgi:hypothetical protein